MSLREKELIWGINSPENGDRAPNRICDSMQLGVHAAFRAANQATTPPVSTAGLMPSDVPSDMSRRS
jgi:hypothetical protein